jgi:cytochrome P450
LPQLGSERLPPGPRGLEVLRTLLAYNRDPFQTLLNLVGEYGDVVRFIAGPVNAFLINGAEHVESVLVRDAWSFVPVRPFTVERAMGQGLFTSDGYLHQHQRELLQGAYAHEHVSRFGEIIARWSAQLRDSWQAGVEMDLEAQMERLVVHISAEILLGDAIHRQWAGLVEPALVVNEYLGTRSTNPLSAFTEALPVRAENRNFWRAMQRLEDGIDRVVAERRAGPSVTDGEHGDFLSTLLAARQGDGPAMSDRQVREEAVANYTTGNAVTVSGLLWTFYLLAQHPWAEARLHAELDDVLADRLPSVEDLPKLKYTRMLIAESMRLYPPAWTIGRRVVQSYSIAGVSLPAGSLVLISPYVMHRDARYFPEPLRFDPERWTPEATASRPRSAYFPFSAGPRSCLGEHLAWIEMQLVVATIAQRWRLQLMLGYPLELLPLIALRPKYGMRMQAQPR